MISVLLHRRGRARCALTSVFVSAQTCPFGYSPTCALCRVQPLLSEYSLKVRTDYLFMDLDSFHSVTETASFQFSGKRRSFAEAGYQFVASVLQVRSQVFLVRRSGFRLKLIICFDCFCSKTNIFSRSYRCLALADALRLKE